MRAHHTIAALTVIAAGTTATAGQATELTAPTAATARTAGVTVGDDFFRPGRLTIRRGTTVRWTWRGRDVHNVTVTSGPARFQSRTQSEGTFSRRLRRRGTYRIICTVHGQRMTIRVR
jgi:plastocyanin